MQLHRAKKGNEDAKTSICLMIAASVGLSTNDVERIFDALYGGTNENKQHKTRYNMKKTIRLSEKDLHRLVNESVRRMLSEMEGNELNLRGDMPDYGTISLSDLQKALKMAWFDDLEKIESREMLFGLDDELKSRVEDILSKYKKLCEECRQLAHQIERMPDYQFSSDYIFNGEA